MRSGQVARSRPSTFPRRALYAVLAIALVSGISACGEQQERAADNLCTRNQQLVAGIAQLKAIDQATATPAEIRARAGAVLTQLDALQAVSEGGYDSQISTLRSAIYDIQQSAVENGAAAQPGKERRDTLKTLNESLTPLQARIAVQCQKTS